MNVESSYKNIYALIQNGQFIWGITNLLVIRVNSIDLHRTFFQSYI